MKTLFQQLGKPTRQVAKEIGCSKTTLLGVINHGVYPKRNGTALRAQIQDYFKQHGIDVSGILSRDTLLYPNQRFKRGSYHVRGGVKHDWDGY
ncbi:hypothetical protein [Kingella kingae]|uniref:hypothetical protein n=1 Tax=Kingella kingae TaxID=504 RepID=UPI000409D503|nr:hypothetical protein [Kingella kingae]